MKPFNIMLLLLTAVTVTTTHAQTLAPTLVGSAGATAQSSIGSLDWSVGEPVASTLTASNTTLSQGFHQVYIFITSDTDESVGIPTLQVKVFPNPTTEYIYVEAAENISARLYNLVGKEAISTTQPEYEQELKVNHLPAGIYLLEIQSEKNNTRRTFKVEILK